VRDWRAVRDDFLNWLIAAARVLMAFDLFLHRNESGDWRPVIPSRYVAGGLACQDTCDGRRFLVSAAINRGAMPNASRPKESGSASTIDGTSVSHRTIHRSGNTR